MRGDRSSLRSEAPGRLPAPRRTERDHFGVLFTSWNLAPLDLFAVVLALASGGLVYLTLRISGKLRAGRLMLGGLIYLAFVVGAVIAVL